MTDMGTKEPKIRFRTNLRKAVEVILWIAQARTNAGMEADFHSILKLLFFAETVHLNRYGRPIVGDRFFARQWGPVASATYDLLKADPLAVQNLEEPLPFESKNAKIIAYRDVRAERLSESDIEALQEAFARYGKMTFRQLTDESHETKAYRNAEDTISQLMSYADFIDETDTKNEKIADLAEIAVRLRA